MAVLEAMAFGCIPIAAPVGGPAALPARAAAGGVRGDRRGDRTNDRGRRRVARPDAAAHRGTLRVERVRAVGGPSPRRAGGLRSRRGRARIRWCVGYAASKPSRSWCLPRSGRAHGQRREPACRPGLPDDRGGRRERARHWTPRHHLLRVLPITPSGAAMAGNRGAGAGSRVSRGQVLVKCRPVRPVDGLLAFRRGVALNTGPANRSSLEGASEVRPGSSGASRSWYPAALVWACQSDPPFCGSTRTRVDPNAVISVSIHR